jgi:hypothetical protein
MQQEQSNTAEQLAQPIQLATRAQAEAAVCYLNSLLELDRNAIGCLIAHRVPVNDQLANHPTANVARQHKAYNLPLLGFINGMFGIDSCGRGPIGAAFDFEEGAHFNGLSYFSLNPEYEWADSVDDPIRVFEV